MPLCSSRPTWLLPILALLAGVVEARGSTPNPLLTLTGSQRSGVYHVAYSSDGHWLAATGKKGTVLWDASGKEGVTLKPQEGDLFSAAFSPDGRRLATAGDDKTVRVWDPATGKELWAKAEHERSVYAVAFSPDGRFLASAGSDRTVILWESATGKVLHQMKGHTDRVLGLTFLPDGARLLSSCGLRGVNDRGGEVKVWDIASGEEMFELYHCSEHGVLTVALSPDGHRLAGACQDGTVCLWELATGRLCLTLKGHTTAVFGVAFSPDGQWLASCAGEYNGENGEIKVWDLARASELRTLRNDQAPVWSLAFSPDGTRLAAAAGRRLEEKFGSTSVWAVSALVRRAATPVVVPGPREVTALWDDLAGADAERAYQAVRTLRACPEQSVPFLRANARTPPALDHAARVPKLVEELDSEDFATRQRASAELEKLGALARPALRQAATMGSLEVRLRANALLEHKAVPPPLSEDQVRTLRAIEVLGTVVHPEARAVLEKLAAGPPGSIVAADAAAALRRLRFREGNKEN